MVDNGWAEKLAELEEENTAMRGILMDCLNDDGFAELNGYGALSDCTKEAAHKVISSEPKGNGSL